MKLKFFNHDDEKAKRRCKCVRLKHTTEAGYKLELSERWLKLAKRVQFLMDNKRISEDLSEMRIIQNILDGK